MTPLPSPLKIVFFGTSDFAVPILERLRADADFEILAVVTQPDKPVGRKLVLTAPPVKRAAETFGLAVWQPEKIRTEEALARFRGYAADLYVVVAYGKILPKALLDLPRLGAVNVHGSILPKYRGASPVSAAIDAGERETGVTVMLLDEKMDEGPMLATTKMPIDPDDTTETLSAKLAKAGAELIGPSVKLYAAGQLAPKPQDHSLATYSSKLDRETGRIRVDGTAAEAERHVRAMRPWPEAHLLWRREADKAVKIAIVKAKVLSDESPCDAVGRPGTVCRLSDGRMGLNCGTGSLEIERLRMEGKAETDGKSFLNGYKDIVGAKLE